MVNLDFLVIGRDKAMLSRFSAYGFVKNLKFFEPFLYLFFLANNLSYFQIGLLITVREAFVNIFEIPTGIIADLTGRRRAMAMAFGSYIFSFALFYSFGSFYLFIPPMILFSMGEALRSGTHKSLIMEYLDLEGMRDKRVDFYGKTRAASRAGSALSAILAAIVVLNWGSYNVTFLAALIPYTIGFLLMLTYPPELDGETSEAPAEEMWKHTVESFKDIFYVPDMRKLFLNSSIYDSFFKISKDYLSPVLESFAVGMPILLGIESPLKRTAILVGVVYSLVYLSGFSSSMISSDLKDKIGNLPRALNLLFFVLAGAFLLIGIFFNLDIAILTISGFFLFYILNNLRRPMVVGLLGEMMSSQKRATLYSAETQMRSIFGMIIAPIFGYIADRAGIAYTFIIGGLILLVLGLIVSVNGE